MRKAEESPIKNKLSLKPLDFAVLVFSLALILCSAFVLYSGAGTGARVIVRGSGRTWVFPLEAEERIAVPGPLGETVVEIGGGQALVLSSPCVNQTCVAAGHIRHPGNWTACLPNKVLVLIEKKENEKPAADAAGTIDAATW
jgi:hypothetical protein